MADTYTLYAWDISYFSGKMQAYLAYKEIPHRLISPQWTTVAMELYPATGLMKVPVVRTPEGQWLQDTTPMIQWFEARHPSPVVIPEDPYQAFFSLLLEDYADEWLWRPALHYRWSYDEDARKLSHHFAETFLRQPPVPTDVVAARTRQRQYELYLWGDGVTDATRGHVESVYLNTLDRLSAVLKNRPFLLGARPSLVDFGFMASMKRHFSEDPTPTRIMKARAPRVWEWVQRVWQARASRVSGPLMKVGTLPKAWGPLLDDVGEAYLPYLLRNAQAYRDGEQRFDCEVQGTRYVSLPTIQYRVWCREALQAAFMALPESVQARVEKTLRQHGCWAPLMAEGVIASNLHQVSPPVCRPVRVSLAQKLAVLATGTAWNRPDTRIGGRLLDPDAAPLAVQLRRYVSFTAARRLQRKKPGSD